MHIIATRTDQGDLTDLVSEAIRYAGDPLPHFTASPLDRAMAAADLAACIRSAASILTPTELDAFGRYLSSGAR